jgi:hypothetical protein
LILTIFPLNENLPKIIFQDLKIGNKRIAVSENGPLKKSIQYSDTILLSHDQSSFSIDFIGVNMTRGEKNNYAYMLEGLDRDWNYVDQLRTATFTNIKPGKYVFKLKAANNDWNMERCFKRGVYKSTTALLGNRRGENLLFCNPMRTWVLYF